MNRKQSETFVSRLYILSMVLTWASWICFNKALGLTSWDSFIVNPLNIIGSIVIYCVWLNWLGKKSHIRILRTPNIQFIGESKEAEEK